MAIAEYVTKEDLDKGLVDLREEMNNRFTEVDNRLIDMEDDIKAILGYVKP